MKAFDIETIPNAAMIPLLPEPEVALGNVKDPDKIREKIDEAKRKQITKMALNPFYGRICSAAFYGRDIQNFSVIPEISDTAEIELLNIVFAWLVVGGEKSNDITTWNGFAFDFPYIYKRAIMLKIELPRNCPPLAYWTKKYSRQPHCDIMQELCGWNTENRLNLDAAGKILLGEGKTARDYSTYVDLIEKGNGNYIGLDNLNDAEHTYKIYEKVAPYLF